MWLVFFLCIIALRIDSATAVHCVAGTWKDSSDNCQLCPEGYAQQYDNSDECLECLNGRYTATNGSLTCSDCPVGFFATDTASIGCTQCPLGSFQSKEGGEECFNCPVGYASNLFKSDSCTQCDIGQYAAEPSQASCKNCSVGFYQDVGTSTECKECAIGTTTTTSGNYVCDQCTSNNCALCSGVGLQNGQCTLCSSGFFSNNTEDCIQCPSGYIGAQLYSDIESIIDTGANICIDCGEGYTVQNNSCSLCPIGKSSTNYVCEECTTGRYSDSPTNNVCKECPVGFRGHDTTYCAACAAGRYQNTPGMESCESCQSGTRSPIGSAQCQDNCPALSWTSTTDGVCESCDAGKTGLSASDCKLCTIGMYKTGKWDVCENCPIGFASDIDAQHCSTCQQGTYAVSGVCQECESGYYMRNYTLTTPPVSCQECERGTYANEEGLALCLDCPIGWFQNNPGQNTCEECQSGRIASDVSSVGCEECPSGFGQDGNVCTVCDYRKVTVNGQCSECAKGTSFIDNQCDHCPIGWYGDNVDSCMVCEEDKYQDQVGQMACKSCLDDKKTNLAGQGSTFCLTCSTDTACQTCSPGTYLNGINCENCAVGMYSGTGASNCVDCQPGFIDIGHIKCQRCPTGQEPTSGTCQNCTIGHFSTEGICKACPLGQYQNINSSDSCKSCNYTQFTAATAATAATDCKECASRYTIAIDGICTNCRLGKILKEGACQECASGKYRSGTVSDCQDCAVGKFSSNGKSACQMCAVGKFADEKGMASCKECESSTDATSCADCLAGKYGTQCQDCPAGYWSMFDEKECSSCSIGQAQAQVGQSSCDICQPGSFAGEPASQVCELCPSGKIQSGQRGGACPKCPRGKFTPTSGSIECTNCPPGTETALEGTSRVIGCINCEAGRFEIGGICQDCKEGFYQDSVRETSCISCPDGQMSPSKSTTENACFSKDGLISYVFGMVGDSKEAQHITKTCEIRPNFVLLCASCTCDDDSRNGFWDGPICNECRRGFATTSCTAICPAYDGLHDSTMCNGNGLCWYGKFGNGLCYCGGKDEIDATGNKVVVDVRLCPKGKICPNYGLKEQTETNYTPLYYIMRYRQFSVFVLRMNKYTPDRGHMWFKRFPPSIAYENTCLSCTTGYANNIMTKVGFWNNEDDYEYFGEKQQTVNGFNGENCQYECGLCLHGGHCNNVPHPFRYSYTILDTFKQQRTVFVPQTQCICSSMVFDPENMCCPSGFQPYIHYGLRKNPNPYTRFSTVPYITSLTNQKKDYWIDKDIWLETNTSFTTPYKEPMDGKIWVATNNNASSEEDFGEVSYREAGPYNKHRFYGVERDMCRACPGLFGKGVRSGTTTIPVESSAESFWWDNAMGASARKCNGIGVCDFYNRPNEHVVDFMGDADEHPLYKRGRICNNLQIATYTKTYQDCLNTVLEQHPNAQYIAFTEQYKGGTEDDMIKRNKNVTYYEDKSSAINMLKITGEAIAAITIDGVDKWAIVQHKLPIPDSDSPYTIHTLQNICIVFNQCDTFIEDPMFSIFSLKFGRGAARLKTASFDRFDTCFTYTKDTNVKTIGLYVTIDYAQGDDPFLGGLCPKGHFCTQYNNIGYKEACPAGYYQPDQGQHRTEIDTQCSQMDINKKGCQSNDATIHPNDYIDQVCIRCQRNSFAPIGSAKCIQCPDGKVKKISGEFNIDTKMLNFPTRSGPARWYYMKDETGNMLSDCGTMPHGIIHMPKLNKEMSYALVDFLPVVACPFGYSSNPGQFIIDIGEDKPINLLTNLMIQTLEYADTHIAVAPYVHFGKFKQYTFSQNCNSKRWRSIKTLKECERVAQWKSLPPPIRRTNNNIYGCWKHATRPNTLFHNFVSHNFDSQTCLNNITSVTYACNSGDHIFAEAPFVAAQCFKCPGNSISGPASTSCTTCFANQMKLYSKLVIQKLAESSVLAMTIPGNPSKGWIRAYNVYDDYIAQQNIDMKVRLDILNIDMEHHPSYGYPVTEVFDAKANEILTKEDCYIACQSSYDRDQLEGIGWSIDKKKCACSLQSSNKWLSSKQECPSDSYVYKGGTTSNVDNVDNGVLTDTTIGFTSGDIGDVAQCPYGKPCNCYSCVLNDCRPTIKTIPTLIVNIAKTSELEIGDFGCVINAVQQMKPQTLTECKDKCFKSKGCKAIQHFSLTPEAAKCCLVKGWDTKAKWEQVEYKSDGFLFFILEKPVVRQILSVHPQYDTSNVIGNWYGLRYESDGGQPIVANTLAVDSPNIVADTTLEILDTGTSCGVEMKAKNNNSFYSSFEFTCPDACSGFTLNSNASFWYTENGESNDKIPHISNSVTVGHSTSDVTWVDADCVKKTVLVPKPRPENLEQAAWAINLILPTETLTYSDDVALSGKMTTKIWGSYSDYTPNIIFGQYAANGHWHETVNLSPVLEETPNYTGDCSTESMTWNECKNECDSVPKCVMFLFRNSCDGSPNCDATGWCCLNTKSIKPLIFFKGPFIPYYGSTSSPDWTIGWSTSWSEDSEDYSWYKVSGKTYEITASEKTWPPWDYSGLPLCKSCQRGQSSGDGGCKSCMVGTYSDVGGLQSCKACEVGQFTNAIGSTACQPCKVGFMQDSMSQESCGFCAEGRYADEEGATSCKGCSTGQFKEDATNSPCENCAVGQYNDQEGATSCKPCSTRRYMDTTGASSCKTCRVGRYMDTTGASSCKTCRAGKYQSATGQETCTSCTVGRFLNKIASSTPCKGCEWGKYQKYTGQTSCRDCSGGRVCSQTSSGTKCPATTYLPAKQYGPCKSCPVDHKSLNSRFGCTWCPTGRTTKGVSGGTCQPCPLIGWHNGYNTLASSKSFSIRQGADYNSCPWGGTPPHSCTGGKGRYSLSTWIVSLKAQTVYFKVKDVDDWVAVQYRFASGASAGRWTNTLRQSRTIHWELSKGQMVQIEYTCDNYYGPSNCEFETIGAVKFFKTKPVTPYCAGIK